MLHETGTLSLRELVDDDGCHVPGPIGKRASLTAERRCRRLEKTDANSLILKETEFGRLLIN